MTSSETNSFNETAGGNLKQEFTDGWQMDKKLGECMVQMFDAQLWTDVTFRCADQSEENLDDRICAHKIVLAARSPLFQVMLFGQRMDTCTNKTIEIHDAQSSHFKMFLRCLYSDSFDWKEDIIELTHVLDLAHKYQVISVVDKCCQELEGKTTIANVFVHLEMAVLYENAHFVEKVSTFIDENAEQILMKEEFVKMSLPCLTHILKGDTFCANEAKIFNKAIEWAKKRCESIDGLALRKTLGEAFYFLRPPLMTLHELITCTKRKGYYTIDEYEDILDNIQTTHIGQAHIACNSKKKRFPKKLNVVQSDVPTVGDKKELITNRTLSEKVTITVNADVHLTHIKLRNHLSVYFNDQEFKLRDKQLSVSLTKDKTCMGTYYVTSETSTFRSSQFDTPGYRSVTVALGKPILFSSGKSNTLTVAIEPNLINHQSFQLKAFPRISENHFNFKNDLLSIKTVHKIHGQRVPGVIRGFKFECLSNR